MSFFLSALVFFLSWSISYAAEFDKRELPLKIIELNEHTLLDNVWPGMTIKQSIQILGEPEEKMKVYRDCGSLNHSLLTSSGSEAIRYGFYWLIPKFDGNQISCIVHQRGLNTAFGHVCRCKFAIKKYVLEAQE